MSHSDLFPWNHSNVEYRNYYRSLWLSEFLNRNQLPLVIIPVNHPAALSDALESFSIPKIRIRRTIFSLPERGGSELVTMYTQAGVQK